MLRRLVTTLSWGTRPRRPDDAPSIAPSVVGHVTDWWRVNMTDHGCLRWGWSNFDRVAPGVFRCNQPHPARLRRYRNYGIKGVLNLRGENRSPAFRIEKATCALLGLPLVSVSLTARTAPSRAVLLDLLDAFDTLPRPFVMHCKSGADRAGLAAALYLIDQGASLTEARRQLALRYLHLPFTRTGVLGTLLDAYAARLTEGPVTLRDWIHDEYDPAIVCARHAARRRAA
ncbi:hypothetical protein SAMN04488003_11730 [Loktanella fryxellensis]|uniref:Tyrosine specific protein phosphatases domain-containing protein n=1 Tax=Loktanella fryxellensis TaxID=245187 RepID=A0A1H8GQ82_9RHOB|nr:tyrosine-protein phosphatase [Loktanella fryxellensis]SEN45657.1 hypothetical protein SAMN04488003_11730 [Loktanella fryxellensis]